MSDKGVESVGAIIGKKPLTDLLGPPPKRVDRMPAHRSRPSSGVALHGPGCTCEHCFAKTEQQAGKQAAARAPMGDSIKLMESSLRQAIDAQTERICAELRQLRAILEKVLAEP